jgi:hypothetical protein
MMMPSPDMDGATWERHWSNLQLVWEFWRPQAIGLVAGLSIPAAFTTLGARRGSRRPIPWFGSLTAGFVFSAAIVVALWMILISIRLVIPVRFI